MIYKDPQGFQYRKQEVNTLGIQPFPVGVSPILKTATSKAAVLQSFCLNYRNTTGSSQEVTAWARLSDEGTENVIFFREDDFSLANDERVSYGLDKVPSLDSTLIPTDTIFEAGIYAGKSIPSANVRIFASWANIKQPSR
jgi:hypothetical protein